MSKKVIVTGIAATASEKTVKDFFLFCGKIKEFELVKAENTDKQIAYVVFEREQAAKTALMLTNAVIGNSQITVKSAEEGASGDEGGYDPNHSFEEDRPKAAIFAEIIAAGHQLTDQIVAKGVQFDHQYGVSHTVKYYVTTLQESLKQYDQQYKLTETISRSATDLDQRYAIRDTAAKAVSQAQGTAAGKRITEVFDTASKAVAAVYAEARRLVEERRALAEQHDETPSQPDVVEAH